MLEHLQKAGLHSSLCFRRVLLALCCMAPPSRYNEQPSLLRKPAKHPASKVAFDFQRKYLEVQEGPKGPTITQGRPLEAPRESASLPHRLLVDH